MLKKELNLYSEFVSLGSYMIVFDTVIEDLPEECCKERPWSVGNNPLTAVNEWIGKNKNFKIICIGASIAIASGDEKPVPTKLKNYEFLWRLRSDFFRRLKRIFETLYYYLKGKYIFNIYNKIRFIIID